MKKTKRTISSNEINQESQKLSSKHSFLIVTYYPCQNVKKQKKKDKIVTLSFAKFVSFYHLIAPEGPRISEIFFAILHTAISIDNRKGFLIFIENKMDKK